MSYLKYFIYINFSFIYNTDTFYLAGVPMHRLLTNIIII